LPQSFERPLAFPTGVALAGLGYSLWRTAGTGRTETTALSAGGHAPHPATSGAK
ncbi:MAG: hypothetical protein QOD41_5068, partial [Cryptosporangiaceae bacterium]|nr:hypothetical protein [Cryptosporangiaceae bacterium]